MTKVDVQELLRAHNTHRADVLMPPLPRRKCIKLPPITMHPRDDGLEIVVEADLYPSELMSVGLPEPECKTDRAMFVIPWDDVEDLTYRPQLACFNLMMRPVLRLQDDLKTWTLS